ncbi:hypothetical protein [Natronobiforma cellulositropha]|uniref:hypothetical protein n=1 Tax=Natronobiforma cellulositropha TaxID=1679076 RepID=UPI0021D5B06F|nr:hypothetical protein [Natronobiforma cellulositropha]
MTGADLSDRIGAVLAVDTEANRRRVAADAEIIERELESGTFDNPQAIVGLEYEFYAVDTETAALQRVPRRLLELIGFEKELGLHNAEMTTSPQPLNEHGLRAQEAEVCARLQAALEVTRIEGMRLVSDGAFTIPPAGETATRYLTDSVERTVPVDGDERPVRLATNMSDAARYHAMANTDTGVGARLEIDAPNVSLAADTVMPESLITSIQPHYQVPHAEDLPAYFTYALRVAGPLLALGVNAPFFPPDLYDEGVSADEVLGEAWMDHRISIFEGVLNASGDGDGKVRFPRDLESVSEAVERIATDDDLVPMPADSGGRFDDEFAHFRRKHGTYWRWVRPVFDGATRSAANARIEFRPLSAQPTVRDTVAFQAALAGLLESLPRLSHPVADLPWERARENFYAAARDGLAADLAWITGDGAETDDTDALYDDLLTHAAEGLSSRGFGDDAVARYLYPLRRRVRQRTTPARWKHGRATAALDEGATLADAITETQRAYVSRQAETLLEGSFADWLETDEPV